MRGKDVFILSIILCVVTMVSIVFWALHPRVATILPVLVLFVSSIFTILIANGKKYKGREEYKLVHNSCDKSNNQSISESIRTFETVEGKKNTCGGILYACVIFFLVGISFIISLPLSSTYTWRASWEYKSNIRQLKNNSLSGEFDHFPDAIPKDAREVKWRVCDGFLQADSYCYLYFETANADTISGYLCEYEDNATIYEYDQENNTWPIHVPGMTLINKGDEKLYKLYILYNNGDINHNHIYGMYVSEELGVICFFKK